METAPPDSWTTRSSNALGVDERCGRLRLQSLCRARRSRSEGGERRGLRGIYASGSSSVVTIQNFSRIREHDNDGVYAVNGARVVVDDSEITLNDQSGVVASGGTSEAFVSGSDINDNRVGLEAYSGAETRAALPGASGAPAGVNNRALLQSFSTLAALSGSSQITAGTGTSSPSRNNDFSRTSEDHAFLGTGAAVTARYNYWGTSSGPSLSYVSGSGAAGFSGCPYLSSLSPIQAVTTCNSLGSRMASADGTSAARSGSHALVDSAYVALEAGDLKRAARLLTQAATRSGADEADVRARAFAAIPRLVRAADVVAPAAGANAVAFLAAQADGPRSRLALRALAAVAAARADYAGSLAYADALLASAGNDEEALGAGHSARVLALAALGRRAEAIAALAAADLALDPESDGYAAVAAAGLDLAYRMEDGAGAGRLAGGSEGFAYGITSEQATRYAAVLHAPGEKPASEPLAATGDGSVLRTGAAPAAFALGSAYPNPSASALSLPVALPEAAEVRVAVYDALGRLVLAAERSYGPGEHVLALDASGLAPGAYVARVVAGEAAGTVRFAVTR